MANRDLISITNHQNSRQVLSLPELSPLPFHSSAGWLAHPKAINLRSVGKSQVYNLTPMTQIQAWPNTSCGRTAPRPPNSTSSPAGATACRVGLSSGGRRQCLRSSTPEIGWTVAYGLRQRTCDMYLYEPTYIRLHGAPGSESNARTQSV